MTTKEMKDYADKYGTTELLMALKRQVNIAIPITAEMEELSLEELNLSVRSCNGLKRAKINNVSELVEAIMKEGGLAKIRNLGKKSILEIKLSVIEEAYNRLNDTKKEAFINELKLSQ